MPSPDDAAIAEPTLRSLERPLVDICLDALDTGDHDAFDAAVDAMVDAHLRFVTGFRAWSAIIAAAAAGTPAVRAADPDAALRAAAALHSSAASTHDDRHARSLRQDACDAARSDDVPRARERCRALAVELRRLHALHCDAVTVALADLADTAGPDSVDAVFRTTAERTLVPWMLRDVRRPVARRLRDWANLLRANFAAITITEEDDRFVLTQHPCGTCGRQIATGLYDDGTLPCLAPTPDSTYGGQPVPVYRAHVDVVHHAVPVELTGTPWPVWECRRDPHGVPLCRVHLYKDPADPAALTRLLDLRRLPPDPQN